MTPLLEARNLIKHFPVRDGLLGKRSLRAVDGVTLQLTQGTTLGIVGESGCGKSTLARLLLGLLKPTSGEVLFKGESIFGRGGDVARSLRRHLQIVFQDPFSSLNPWMSVGEIIGRPLVIHGMGSSGDRRRRVRKLLDLVGLPVEAESRLPHEFSGGQRQRIAVARALATNPDVIVADEPTSALDVSVQASILNLMKDLQEELGVSYVFISHDIRVIQHMCDEMAVMYLGRIVEHASTREIFSIPHHPYTLALLAAVPKLTPGGQRMSVPVEGDPPSALFPPPGCRFHPRCSFAEMVCSQEDPPLRTVRPEHLAACHFAEAIARGRFEGTSQAMRNA